MQQTISRERRKIAANETRTRHALIDPILGEMGWADPSVLTPEYLVRKGPGKFNYGMVDYALHAPGNTARPFAFIEAKRMRTELTDEHRDQAFGYASDKGASVTCVVVTNGDVWECYRISGGHHRRVCRLSITSQSAADCAKTLMDGFNKLIPKAGTEVEGKAQVHEIAFQEASVVMATPEGLAPVAAVPVFPVDTPKILMWFTAAAVLGGVAGYVVGFRMAGAQGGTFATIGMVVAVIAVIGVVLMARTQMGFALRGVLGAFQLKRTCRRSHVNERTVLLWLGMASVAGVFGGGALGYLTGLATAQSVLNFLGDLGKIVVFILIAMAAIFVLLVLIFSACQPKKRK